MELPPTDFEFPLTFLQVAQVVQLKDTAKFAGRSVHGVL